MFDADHVVEREAHEGIMLELSLGGNGVDVACYSHQLDPGDF